MLQFLYCLLKGENMEQKEKSKQAINYIINCGINEFAEKGHLVSLNGICKKYNISKGKLYHHFSSKEELMCACICTCLKELTQNINNFNVNNALTAKENFHNYYFERINHWHKNYNQLTVLRLAYSLSNNVLNDESLNKIKAYRDDWRCTKKNKILEILHSENNSLRINDENIAEIMLLMYENTFQVLEDKMINAIKSDNINDTKIFTQNLIDYHDSIIDMILYGAIKK